MDSLKRKISAVIVGWNRQNALSHCLASLITPANEPYLCEIIYVDNGSTDGTLQLLRQLKNSFPYDNLLKVIMLPDNKWGVISRNLAFQQAQGDFILQIDTDVMLSPTGIGTMLDYFAQDVIAVGPQGFWVCQDWSNFNGHDPGVGGYVDTVTGFCYMFRNNKSFLEPWQYPWEFAPFWHEEAALCLEMRYQTRLRCRKTSLVCAHNTAGHASIDWDLHNRNLASVVHKYKPLHLQGLLKLERDYV